MDDHTGGAGTDWERWRGGVDRRLQEFHEDLLDYKTWRAEHERDTSFKESKLSGWITDKFDRLHARVGQIEVRVAFYAGAASFFGTGLSMIITRMLD